MAITVVATMAFLIIVMIDEPCLMAGLPFKIFMWKRKANYYVIVQQAWRPDPSTRSPGGRC